MAEEDAGKVDTEVVITGKHMSLVEFASLLDVLAKKHKWPCDGRGIKYVRPQYDTRTGDIVGVQLENPSGLHDFFLTKEESKDKDLNTWVLDWLKEGEKGECKI